MDADIMWQAAASIAVGMTITIAIIAVFMALIGGLLLTGSYVLRRGEDDGMQ